MESIFSVVSSLVFWKWIGAIVALLVIFFSTYFTVSQQTAVVVERFGKFNRIAKPGLRFKLPFVEQASKPISLRVRPLDVVVETKTSDNVFVHTKVSVQYKVIEEKVYDAFYKLTDHVAQITSYVFDVVRAKVPAIKLDDVFEKKDEIAVAVKHELDEVMNAYGYDIVKALVTDIDPDAHVKESMNKINAAQRNRMAAAEQGEADKILVVKKAEAEAESKKLQGEGIANQRKAIVAGLQTSVEDFKKTVTDVTAKDVLDLVLVTQYFDTLKEIGANSRSNTIFIPHEPGGVSSLTSQLRNSMVAANAANTGSEILPAKTDAPKA